MRNWIDVTVDVWVMARTTLSKSGRFIVIDDLHVDRSVVDELAIWSERHGLTLQDGIQLALVFFSEQRTTAPDLRSRPDGVEAPSNPALP